VWRVSLEDEGPGLTPEQRRKLFERFVRFGPPDDSDKGSGLGLAISRSIVQLHRGRIFALDGAEGRGLRMVIEIPAASA
jgi:signal transduction histidine kinase